jgi:Uma2 family endonuclease
MSTIPALLTVDEFLKLPQPEDGKFELLEGELVYRAVGEAMHEWTKSNMNMALAIWLAQHPIGKLFIEAGYRLGEHSAPIPDLSMVLNERLEPGKGLTQGAPDLAIEVVSSEAARDLQRKIALYLGFGGQSVWSVFPAQRCVIIDRANGQITRLLEHQLLEDPGVLPGFSMPVSAIFEGL